MNFFHRNNDALLDYLGGSNAPLVLAGLGYLHPLYKQANSYPNLVDEGITKDVSQMPKDELHQLSWDIVKNKYQMDGNCPGNRAAEGWGVGGNFDPDDIIATIDDKHTADNQDLLDLAAAQTIINGGNELLIPQE